MSLRKQAASLAIMHVADVLQPLLILPYAGRMLGANHFGQFAYAVAIGALASLLADVVATKLMLCLIVTAVGLAAADSFFAISKSMFLCTMLTAAGNILFPAWLFIALERAWQAALATVVARSLALVWFLA